ncbi:hypothetical protein D3C86_1100100 [compost metagenome]
MAIQERLNRQNLHLSAKKLQGPGFRPRIDAVLRDLGIPVSKLRPEATKGDIPLRIPPGAPTKNFHLSHLPFSEFHEVPPDL